VFFELKKKDGRGNNSTNRKWDRINFGFVRSIFFRGQKSRARAIVLFRRKGKGCNIHCFGVPLMNPISQEEWNGFSCPNCENETFFDDHVSGSIICRECGVIVAGKMIDPGAEWRIYDNWDHYVRIRVGAPPSYTLADKGLCTIIDRRNEDAFGKKISPSRHELMVRLRYWQTRMQFFTSTERSILKAMTELDRLSALLGISKPTKESAAIIYRRIKQLNLTRSRSIQTLMAAALYIACRCRGHCSWTLDEFARCGNLEKNELGRCYRVICKAITVHVPEISPEELIARLASSLQIEILPQQFAINILSQAKRRGMIGGKNPAGLAAAALYIACLMHRIRISQNLIATSAHVTEVTVRNRYKELVAVLHLNLKSNFDLKLAIRGKLTNSSLGMKINNANPPN
jgi:transcription initiation factor TFIIB